MKLDKELISQIEKENNAICLTNLQKEHQYIYHKATTRYPNMIIKKPITLKNGNTYYLRLIKKTDIELLKHDDRFSELEKKQKRSFLGRKFDFCKGCSHENDCSLDIPCEKRYAKFSEKKKIREHENDIRFWNNGKPKKHLILCQYAKYLYAHKNAAGHCQGWTCSFYDKGNCFLNLNPEKNNMDTEEIMSQSAETVLKNDTVKYINKNNIAMKNDNEIENLIQKLKELDESLTKIENAKSNELNIFYAVGMNTQEIKHSAFLAWLLNPKQTHGLGNDLLSFLLQKLLKSSKYSEEIRSNAEILEDQGFLSFSDFSEFLASEDISVETEKIISSSENRIDIFIQSLSALTTIIIENKIFTSTHDNQLYNYKKESESISGKKIYIYLTPQGDIPTDIDGKYEKDWCILSYNDISEMIKSILNNVRQSKSNNKLIYLMEDYLKMLDAEVLMKNEKLSILCKQIKKKHADALEILSNYTDNTENIMNFGYNWIIDNVPNIEKIYRKNKVLCGYTEPIKNFYKNNGVEIKITDSWFRFQFQMDCDANGYTRMLMGVGKQSNDDWLEQDLVIKNILMPNKKMTNKYCTLYTLELLNQEEFQEPMEEIETKLSSRLLDFAKKLKFLEDKLSKMKTI